MPGDSEAMIRAIEGLTLELRQMREEVIQCRVEIGTMSARLDAYDKVEGRVAALEAWQGRAVGIFSAVSALGATIAAFVATNLRDWLK